MEAPQQQHENPTNPRSPDYELGRLAGIKQCEDEILTLKTRILEPHVEKNSLITWITTEERKSDQLEKVFVGRQVFQDQETYFMSKNHPNPTHLLIPL